MGLRELCPELRQKALDELNEDPERVKYAYDTIREWLSKQPHLGCARTDDNFLSPFLRCSKYSIERAKERIDLFYTVKSVLPELCYSGDPMNPKVQELLSYGVQVPLLKTESPGSERVIINRIGVIPVDRFTIYDVLRVTNMISFVLHLEDDNCGVAGRKYIYDAKNVTLSTIAAIPPSVIKKFTAATQNVMPIRNKGSIHINVPSGIETFFNVVKRFMNEKNRSRLFVHENVEALYNYVPKSILPTEYGGEAGPIQDMIDYWKRKIESYRDFFIEEENLKSDESKRIEKPKYTENLFGMEGSFRQLDVD